MPHRPVIVLCDLYSSLYGAQRSALTLYSHWQSEGRYRLHFLYTKDGPFSEAIRAAGITATQLPTGTLLGSFNKRLFNLRAWDYPGLLLEAYRFSRRLRDLLVELDAALLHCNNDRAGLTCFAGARWAGVPMVTHVRRDRSFGWLDRFIFRVSTEMIWVSRGIEQTFLARNELRPTKGRVIYNGRALVDAGAPSTREDICEELSLRRDAFIALVVASLEERKDHETLIEAAALACREEPRLIFLLAGVDPSPDGTRRDTLEHMVRDKGLGKHVLFLGHRHDVGRLMRGADVLVNPAKEEALGGALIEAMGYGLPAVATEAGGTREIVPDGHCGYLVPRRDPAALAERTVALVRDDATREAFRRNARAHFAEHFTVERCAERTGEFFDEVMAAFGRVRSMPAAGVGTTVTRDAAPSGTKRRASAATVETEAGP